VQRHIQLSTHVDELAAKTEAQLATGTATLRGDQGVASKCHAWRVRRAQGAGGAASILPPGHGDNTGIVRKLPPFVGMLLHVLWGGGT
jgi:hypothetical protein